jgi:hypothetical protein
MKKDYIGFGYNPAESDNHFYVVINEDKQSEVCVYERFGWDENGEQKIRSRDILKLRISRYKWSKLVSEVTNEFNSRLKEAKEANR